MVDGLIIGVVFLIGLLATRAAGYLLAIIVAIVYQTLMIGRPQGQTVGNMAVGTRVVDAATGQPIGYGRAAGRYIIVVLIGIVPFVGTLLDDLWPLWDRRKQTLHDKAVASVVVRTR